MPKWPFMALCARLMPTMEPISVCDEETGRPSHQVPRFHRMAAISRAKIIASPLLLPTCSSRSTGSRATMPNATAPLESSTPRKLQKPDQPTATRGGRALV
ncbi:hypothetical protein D9M71_661480 [compost metagenome]